VLDREQAEQDHIDQDRLRAPALRSDVNRLGDEEVADKGRRVGK